MQLASLLAADQDNNGRITFNEYIRALGLCIAAAPPIGSSSAMTELQFLMIDLNNNGAVDATELATFIGLTLFCEKGLRESGSLSAEVLRELEETTKWTHKSSWASLGPAKEQTPMEIAQSLVNR